MKQEVTPESIASQLFDCVQRAAPESGVYKQAIGLTQREEQRFLFSLLLYPLGATHGLTAALDQTSPSAHLFSAAHEIYLDRVRDQDALVKLGDYVIWRIECEAVIAALRDDFGQLVLPSEFDARQIRYGMLFRIIAQIRKRTFVSDMRYALNIAPANEPKEHLKYLFIALGTSFTRHTLRIDPSDASNPAAITQRFQASVGLGGIMLAKIYFQLIDLVKESRS
jgi:sulfur transfer complex TusBCD TusB component (DsrH family)